MIELKFEFDYGEIDKLEDELMEEMNARIRDIADAIFAESQFLVPVDKSILKDSGTVIYGDGYAWIGYNAPYASVVHDGFSAHDQSVRAHSRTMNGIVVRVRGHTRHMPERTGRPYLDDAIEKVKGEIDLEGIEITRRDI